MKIILADLKAHLRFAPLSLTRPIGDIRVGMFTNYERWSILLPEYQIGFHTESYLSDEFEQLEDGVIVNACVIPNEDFVTAFADATTIIHCIMNDQPSNPQSLMQRDVFTWKIGAYYISEN